MRRTSSLRVPHSALCVSLSLLAFFLFTSPTAKAANYTWDASGGAPLNDGGGNWNPTGGTNWFDGVSTYGAWGNTTSDTATFGVNNGAAGTISIGTVNANGITFNAPGSGNYTLSSGTITLGGTTPTITANVDGTIGSTIAGTAGLTKAGSGTLLLTANNSYSGTTNINNGMLQVGNNSVGVATINNSATVNISSGATFRYYRGDTSQLTLLNTFTGAGTIRLSGAGAVDVASQWTTSQNNSGFTGNWLLDGARYAVDAVNDVGSNSTIEVGANGQLFTSASLGNNITITDSSGWRDSGLRLGAIRVTNGVTLSGNIVLNQTTGVVLGDNSGLNSTISSYNQPGNATLSGVISGTGEFSMSRYTAWNGGAAADAGFTISGSSSNTYTGKTVINGQLVGGATVGAYMQLAKTGGAVAIQGGTTVQMGNNTGGQAQLYMGGNDQFGTNNGGVLMNFVNTSGNWMRFSLMGTTQTLAGIDTSTVSGGTVLAGAVVQNGRINIGTATDATLTLNGNGTYLYNGIVRDFDNVNSGGKMNLVKSGSGTQTLVGNSVTYTGTTTLSGGTLSLQDTTAFNSAISVGGSGTLNAARTVAGFASRSAILANAITGSGIININGAANGIGTTSGGWTTVNGGTGSLNFSGTINVNSGVFARDNTQVDTINGTATVNVASGAGFGAGRGGNSTIGALNGAGDVGAFWSGGNIGSITIGNGDGSGTFSGVLHGNGNATDGNIDGGILRVVKIGSGTQTLSGANTYTGGTTIKAGTLSANTSAGSLSTSGTITLGDTTGTAAATLDFSGTGFTATNTTGITVAAGSSGIKSITTTGANSFTDNAPITLNDNLTISPAGTLTLGGVISGSTFGITKTGAGTAVLTGANSYTGATNVNTGTLQIGAGGGTGSLSSSSAVSIGSSGTLLYNRNDSGAEFTIANNVSGTGAWNFTSPGGTLVGRYTLTGNNASFTGPMTIDHARVVVASNSQLGGGPVTVNAVGQLSVNGSNSYSNGLTLNSTGWIESGATSSFGALRIDQGANWSGSVLLNSSSSIGSGGTGTISGVISDGGGGFGLTKLATGSITLSGASANTYSGTTSVAGGALILSKTAGVAAVSGNLAINGSATVWSTADNQLSANTIVSNGNNTAWGSFALQGTTQTIAGLSNTTGTLMVANSTTSAATPSPSNGGTGTLVLAGTGTYSFNGDLWDAWGGAGKTALLKSGSGTQTLSGVQITYTGGTTVNAGTLKFDWTARGNTQFSQGAFNIGPSGTLELNNTSALAFASATLPINTSFTGSGTITKTGTGIIDLFSNTNINTFTGLVDVQAGMLTDQSGSWTAGAMRLNVASGAYFDLRTSNVAVDRLTGLGTIGSSFATQTLTVGSQGGSSTFDGVIQNTVPGFANTPVIALTKTGAGTFTLTGANANTGATTVNGGTLSLSGANGAAVSSGSFTVNSGATLLLDNTSTANNGNRIGAVTITLNGGTMNFSNNAGAANYSETVGTLAVASGNNTVSASQAAVGQTSALTFSSLSRTAGATVNFTGTGLGVDTRNQILFTAAPTLSNGLIGTWATWNGTDFATYGANGVAQYTGYIDVTRLSSGSKTITSVAASNVRIIEGTGLAADITPAASGTTDINSLLQSASGGTATYNPAGADVLRLGASGGIMIANAAGGLSIGTTANDGTLTAGGAANTAGTIALTNASSNALIVNSTIANNGTGAISVIKAGSGAATLAGTNSYTGSTTINQGILSVATLADGGNNSGIGASTNAAGNLVLGGGTLQYTGGTVSSNRAYTLTAGTTSTIDVNSGAATLTISGAAASTTGALTKAGSGTLVLSGANAHSGDTKITGGTLTIGTALALQNSTLDYGSYGGSLSFGTVTSATFGGLKGSQNLALTNTTPAAVALTVGGNNQSTTYSGALSGSGSLTKAGTGVLTLSGTSANSYSGTTALNAGITVASKTAGVVAIPGDITMANGSSPTLYFTANNQLGGSGTLSFTGASGNARFNLFGTTQSVAGISTTNSNSVIQNSEAINGAPSTGTSGTLTLTGSGTYSYNGFLRDLTGQLGLTKTGSGTQTVSGANVNYTGPTAVNNGILELSDTTNYASATTIANGATVKVTSTANQNPFGGSFTLSSGATFIHNGTNSTNEDLVLTNPFTVSGTTTLNENSVANTTGINKNLFLDGGLVGSGTLTINAANAGNAVVLRNANTTFTGNIIVNGIANKTVNLGSGIGIGGANTSLNGVDFTVNGTMELLNQGIGWASNITNSSFGALSGTGVVVGNYTGGGTITLTLGNTGNNGAFSGEIADGAGNKVRIAKVGSGTQTFTGTNTYTGLVTIQGGTLSVSSTAGLGTGVSGEYLQIINGATLQYTGAGNQSSTARDVYWNGGNATIDIPSATANLTLNITGGTRDNPFTKSGAGQLTLSKSAALNNLTGSPVLITGGILEYNENNAGAIDRFQGVVTGSAGTQIKVSGTGYIGNEGLAANWSSNLASLDIGGSASFDLRGNPTPTVIDALTGSGSVANSFANGTTSTISTLTLGANNGSGVFTGTIKETAPTGFTTSGSPVTALIKNGNGTQELGGTNTYTGTTTVNNGILKITGTASNTTLGNTLVNNGELQMGKTAGLNAIGSSNLFVGDGSGAAQSAVARLLASNQIPDTTDVTIFSDGKFDLNSFDEAINNLLDDASGNSRVDGTSGTPTFTVASGSFAGVITDTAGTLKLVKNTSGNLLLAGANSYAGATDIQQGILAIGAGNDRLPITTTVTLGNGTTSGKLRLAELSSPSARNQTLSGLLTSGTGTTNRVVGGAAANSVLTLNIAGSNTYDGFLGGPSTNENRLALTKTGVGTLTLTANNTYLGVTNVNQGTLVLNGTHTPGAGAGLYTVNNGGTLKGSGITNGNLAVLAGGKVAPGNSIESLGVGDILFSGGTLEFEFNTTSITADLLYGDDGSTLTLSNNPLLTMIDLGGSIYMPVGTKFTLIAYDGAWNNGTFSGYADDSQFIFGPHRWLINYNDTSAGSNFIGDTIAAGDTAFVTLTVTSLVPEPSTWAMGLIGLVGLALFAWRKKSHLDTDH